MGVLSSNGSSHHHLLMKTTIAILLLASASNVGSLSTNSSQTPPPAKSSPKVTAYLLVVQWPPGVCNGISDVTTCKKPVQPEFKIHGFWQQYPRADPQKMSDGFVYNKGLLAALRNNWPTSKAGDQDPIFWSEQWYKHGIYSEMEEAAYFQKTLDLLANVGQELEKRLAAEKIPPNGRQTYKLKDVEAALKEIIEVNCRVICAPSKTNRNVALIQKVRISYTTNLELQGTSESLRCKSDVMFPF